MFFRFSTSAERRRHRAMLGLRRHLSPRLIRDIGLDPRIDEPRVPAHPLLPPET